MNASAIQPDNPLGSIRPLPAAHLGPPRDEWIDAEVLSTVLEVLRRTVAALSRSRALRQDQARSREHLPPPAEQASRRSMRDAFARAAARGEVLGRLDIELILDMLTGPFYYRTLFRHVRIGRRMTLRIVRRP
ncbi:MAG: TetR/AcrR family transcriptional regulator C-terminal ligand-binding domain-containing protein [Steroidobacteraceae bacterium]